MTTDNQPIDDSPEVAATPAPIRGETGRSRREVVRQGVKLAFVTPVIATFFARDAYAAASAASCHSPGHPCTTDANCCAPSTCDTFVGSCQ